MNLLQNKKLEQDFLWVYTVSLTTVYHTYQNKHTEKLFTFSFRVQSCPVRNSRQFSAISDFTRLCHFPLLSDLMLHIQSQPVKQDLSAFLLHFSLKKEKPMQLPGLLTWRPSYRHTAGTTRWAQHWIRTQHGGAKPTLGPHHTKLHRGFCVNKIMF